MFPSPLLIPPLECQLRASDVSIWRASAPFRFPSTSLSVSLDQPKLVLRIFACLSGFEDGSRSPLVLPSMSSNSSSVRCSNPINALFALLTRMSSSSFTWTAAEFPVLRILNQEHHQKRDDGRAGVDYKLPCVRETEHRTRNGRAPTLVLGNRLSFARLRISTCSQIINNLPRSSKDCARYMMEQ